MKAWIVGITITVVVIVAGVGLWMTWDSTQTTAPEPMTRPMALRSRDVPPLSVDGVDGLDGVDREGDEAPSAARGPAECTPREAPATRDPLAHWDTVVVDPAHRLPADFVPPDLVDIRAAGFESSGDQVRRGVITDLAALRTAAEANGTPFVVVSAYRSYEHQRRLYQQQVDELGRAAADASTARPGHSEHQLGTTIDVLDTQSADLTSAFGATPAGRWLAAHAHEYGFVMSYPNEARERTCYDYEPWHLRYVGRDTARRIHDSGLTPREWMLSRSRTVR